MPFHVICLETKQPYCSVGNLPEVWATGDSAAIAADYLTQRDGGRKWKPMRVKGEPGAWKARERARFLDGLYDHLPWATEPWWRGSIGETEHFAHVSRDKPGMIAFVGSDEQGEADTQTRIKPGTYLERFYSDKLTSALIQKYARDFAGKYEINGLKFATTEDEIARVYIKGPRSCMSGPEKGVYQSPFHPSRVYAAGDLAVAYLERNGAIAARSVVWPDKKLYYNIYGDADRMQPLLRQDGYKQGRLTGARLKRVEHNKGSAKYCVCPHIDGVGAITDKGDHLVIGGDIPANSTCGLIMIPHGLKCTCCGTWGHTELTSFPDNRNARYCHSCAVRNTYLCSATNTRYANSANIVCMEGTYYWGREHFRKHGVRCEYDGRYYPRERSVTLSDGRIWGKPNFERYGFTCRDCKGNFPRNSNNQLTCETCRGAT